HGPAVRVPPPRPAVTVLVPPDRANENAPLARAGITLPAASRATMVAVAVDPETSDTAPRLIVVEEPSTAPGRTRTNGRLATGTPRTVTDSRSFEPTSTPV